LATALIWLVHPLNSEAINYVTQRTESMMALFYLLTIYASIRALGSARAGRGPPRPSCRARSGWRARSR
jgi:hypothetical protein